MDKNYIITALNATKYTFKNLIKEDVKIIGQSLKFRKELEIFYPVNIYIRLNKIDLSGIICLNMSKEAALFISYKLEDPDHNDSIDIAQIGQLTNIEMDSLREFLNILSANIKNEFAVKYNKLFALTPPKYTLYNRIRKTKFDFDMEFTYVDMLVNDYPFKFIFSIM